MWSAFTNNIKRYPEFGKSSSLMQSIQLSRFSLNSFNHVCILQLLVIIIIIKIKIYQKCGKQTLPAKSSDTTVIQRASTKNI